jgi:hypothetical protein
MSLTKAWFAPVEPRMTKGRLQFVNMYLTNAGSAQVSQRLLQD